MASPPVYRSDGTLADVVQGRQPVKSGRNFLDMLQGADEAVRYYGGPHVYGALGKLANAASYFSPASDVIDAGENYRGAIESARSGDVTGAVAQTGYGLLSNMGLSEISKPVAAMAAGIGVRPGAKVYHGTTHAGKIMDEGFKPGWTHLTDSREVADSYQEWSRGGDPGTIEAYVDAKNPAYYDAEGKKYTDIGNKVYRATADAQRAGHDALIIKNIRDHFDSSVPVKPHTTYVVFSPEIISAVRKYGIPGAIAAGIITTQQAEQMQAEGVI